MIQLKSSSSFNSLLQNIPFYHSTTTPLKPYLGKEYAQFPTVLHYTTARKIRTDSGKTKMLHPTKRNLMMLSVFCCFFFVRFSSNKSLSTPDFFLMVMKNTLMVSQRHSLDLE